jgi:hypothetical protein
MESLPRFGRYKVFKLGNLSFRYLHRVSHFYQFLSLSRQGRGKRKITACLFSDLNIYFQAVLACDTLRIYHPGITGHKREDKHLEQLNMHPVVL